MLFGRFFATLYEFRGLFVRFLDALAAHRCDVGRAARLLPSGGTVATRSAACAASPCVQLGHVSLMDAAHEGVSYQARDSSTRERAPHAERTPASRRARLRDARLK